MSHVAPRMPHGLARLNAASEDHARELLAETCGSSHFARELTARRPFASTPELLAEAEAVATSMRRDDWLEAFACHPRIGDPVALAADTAESAEQAGMRNADEATAQRIAALNDAYEARFGFIYLVCASGRSPDELLQILESRIDGDVTTEWQVAAAQQRQITALRLRALADG